MCLRDLLSFLTLIPTGSYSLERAAKCFFLVPLVGAVVGILAIAPLLLKQDLFSSLLSFLIFYLITGLNHLDGFSDFVDVLASGKRGEEALRILKEPWRGSFSQSSLAILLISAFVLIYLLRNSPLAIILVNVFSYESMYLLSLISPLPPYEGLGSLFSKEARRLKAKTGNILTFIVLILGISIISVVYGIKVFTLLIYISLLLLSSITSITISLRQAKRSLGFVNGDVLGYNFEVSRILGLLFLALAEEVLRTIA